MKNENLENSLVISKEKVNLMHEKISECKHGREDIKDKDQVIESKNYLIESSSDKKYSIALARTMLPVNDPCACIKIENGKIFWSSNREGSEEYCKEILKIFSEFAKKQFIYIDKNDSDSEDYRELVKEYKDRLTRKAIVKDQDQCSLVDVDYKKFLPGTEIEVWRLFRRSFGDFKGKFETEKLSRKNPYKKTDLTIPLQMRGELVKVLNRERAKNEDLTHRLFWPLLNVNDVELIFSNINEHGYWWKRVSESLRSEDGFRILSGLQNQHAEQKMLGKDCSFFGTCEFLREISENSSWTAITKKLCLFCEMTFSSCERASELGEGEVIKGCVSSGKYYKNWKSFCLEDNQEREKISTQWDIEAKETLDRIENFEKEEDVWMEETTLEADLFCNSNL